MPEDMKTDDSPFGLNKLQDKLKEFCKEQGLDMPLFWNIKSDEYCMGYAVSIHLNGKDRWEEFDTMTIFLLRDFSQRNNREVEERLLKYMFEELGEPIVLTSIVGALPSNQKRFYKSIGLTKLPVTWSDNHQNEYEVYTKGRLEMGGFVNLMERVEYIGKEIVYKND